jgi:hypothetical protein
VCKSVSEPGHATSTDQTASPLGERTIYLGEEHNPMCAILHPADGAASTAVILVPPFGWDEVCSYRSRRVWAQALADAGIPALRLSLPSTGDSGGVPRDPGRLATWTAALTSAATWLRTTTGARRTVVVGIELGGVLAYRAAAMGAPIDDLVLWGTPARARGFIRQFRAFSKLEVSEFFRDLEAPPPLPNGDLEAGGFLLTAETVNALEALDLADLTLPDASSRRILLLDRDGIAVDDRLRERVEADGAAVTVAAGPGYATMCAHPQTACPPFEVMDLVTDWLKTPRTGQLDPPPEAPPSVSQPPTVLESATVGSGPNSVRETPFALQQPFGRLAGILSEPVGRTRSGLCAVLLNAGAVRRIGPNRMWVEAARRWAELGVPTLRLDVEGIGDADGEATPYVDDADLYVPELVPQVLAALDALEARGVGERFVVGGLCAGAYWAFHAALEDPRVTAALMVNPRALIWDPGLLPARDLRALLRGPVSWSQLRLASAARVRRLLAWLLQTPGRALKRLRSAVSPALRKPNEVDLALHRLIESGKRAMLLFSCDERLHDELVRSGRMARLEGAPNMTLEYIAVRDHTLRPNWAQNRAHAALDRALRREITINERSSRGN